MKDKLEKLVLNNSLLYFIFILLTELIIRLNVGFKLIDWSILRIILSSLIISIILGFITSLFKRKTANIIGTIITFGITIYAWVEINLFNFLGFFMGAGNAEQGTKIVDYIKDFISSAKFISYLVIIPLILYLFYIWYIRKKLRIRKLNKTIYFKFTRETILNKLLVLFSCITIIIVLGLLYYFSLTAKFMQNKLQSIDDKTLILTSDNSNLSVSRFGVLMYGISDVIIQVFDIEVDDVGEVFIDSKKEEKQVSDYTRHIDDTAWKNVMEKELNSTYKKLDEYFINRDITDKNQYTGIFEGKNLIVVLMESVNMISINEKEFPTIYKIYNEGISFRNNYSPRNNCSTGNNEMTVMTSLFTINNTCTANTYKRNTYPEAIFNLFNEAGYKTTSYHDYAEVYYARRTIHPNMGSSKYYNVKDLGIKWSSVYEEWPSDVDLVETATPHFINDDHFMVFLTSVTTHQPYGVSSENGDKHLSEFEEYDYAKPVKRYMSKMKELDASLELLLKKLEEAGKLDDTVIALFADHYPYGLTDNQINSVLDYDVTVNNEVDRTPMVIYNPTVQAQKVEKYTSIIDLLPTLLNMFNLNYDPRLYLGNDIFSDYEDRTVFSDGSWQDSKGYYSATKGKFKPVDESNTYTDEELIVINAEIKSRQKMSALAIKNNYFNYLNKRLIKYNEQQEELKKQEELKQQEEMNNNGVETESEEN